MSDLVRNLKTCFLVMQLHLSDKKVSHDKRKPVFGVFGPGLTQTGLCSQSRRLEAGNFGYKKKRDCTI